MKKKTVVWQWFMIILLLLSLAACRSEVEQEFPITLVVPTAVGSGGEEPVAALPTASSAPIQAAATVTIAGDESDATAVSLATPTLQSTATPAGTPTAPPVTNPVTSIVSRPPLPGISRDLLFIADGALQLWARNGQVETILPGGGSGERERPEIYLTGDVSSFAVTADGRFLVAARVTHTDPISPTRAQTFTIVSVNLDRRESRTLVAEAFDVRALTIAGDGQHVAFVAQTAQSEPAEAAYEMRVVQVGSGAVKIAAPCAIPCGNLAWHPDNQNVVWGDGEMGVRLYNVTAREPQLLLASPRSGGDVTVYGPIAWARNGRFLLMWRSAIEGGDRVVLDVPTGQVMPIPNSFVYADPHWTAVTWMQDDRLLVSRPQLSGEQLRPPVVEIWRVNPDQVQLVLEETDALAVAPSGIAAPLHLESGRFGFLLYNPIALDANGVYLLKGFGDQLDRVNALWPAATAWDIVAAWNPDGSGVIIRQANAGVFYAPTNNSALYNIQPALGQWPRDFYWLPPRIQP